MVTLPLSLLSSPLGTQTSLGWHVASVQFCPRHAVVILPLSLWLSSPWAC
jgi:hypothetical protein